MMQTCRWCSSGFEITNEDLVFYENISPVFGGKKYVVPPPTLCPECRQQRRLCFRNERKLYANTCKLTGASIISIYSPDKPFTVYDQQVWWSDRWDPLSYGQDFDFSQSFHEQCARLFIAVPKLSLMSAGNYNAEFVNFSGWNKNCYLLFEADNNQDCYYGEYSYWNKDSIDISYVEHSELCCNCANCYYSYNIKWSQNCYHCTDSLFLRDCSGCKNCFGCINMHNRQNCFFNEQYSQEEYNKRLGDLSLDTHSAVTHWQEKFCLFAKNFPHKYMHGKQNENVLGDYLQNCKDSFYCFDGRKLQDCKFIFDCEKTKNSYDVEIFGGDNGMELAYEGLSVGNGAYNILFSSHLWENTANIYYSDLCKNSSHLFGCVGLRHKQYCILNKQYTKEEYETLLPKIIDHMMKTGEWGEFLPPSSSPFGYNETMANEYFPLTKEDALRKGYQWSEYIPPTPTVAKVITKEQMKKLPDSIKDIPDDILNWALTCEVSGKPFKIIKQELKFYRDRNLPIPRRHPDQRYADRMALRNPRKLWMRQCDCVNEEHDHSLDTNTQQQSSSVEWRHASTLREDNANNTHRCPHTFQTTYSPDRPEKVYCEECYLKEVY